MFHYDLNHTLSNVGDGEFGSNGHKDISGIFPTNKMITPLTLGLQQKTTVLTICLGSSLT